MTRGIGSATTPTYEKTPGKPGVFVCARYWDRISIQATGLFRMKSPFCRMLVRISPGRVKVTGTQ